MSNSTRLNPEQVLLLEQDLLRAPLEQLRKLHKSTSKTYQYNLNSLEKDVESILIETAKKSSSQTNTVGNDEEEEERKQSLSKVESMLSRMKGLQKKLLELERQTNEVNETLRVRLRHLSRVPTESGGIPYDGWMKERLNHHLIDYCQRIDPPLRRTAEVLAKEERVERFVDRELWDELDKVERALREKDLEAVLSWVGENRTALKKLKSPLEFTIHLQKFIELCRVRNLSQAILYARRHLSPATVAAVEFGGGVDGVGDEKKTSTTTIGGGGLTKDSSSTTMQMKMKTPMEELKRVMALLAYPPETNCRIYSDLYSPHRWTQLSTLFRTTFLTLHSLPTIPLLHMSLQAGLASLKTPVCCPHPNPPTTTATTNQENGSTVQSRNPTGTLTISPSGQLILIPPPAPPPLPSSTPPVPTPFPSHSSPVPSNHSSTTTPSLSKNPLSTTSWCPLCTSPLSILTPSVPYSHHVNSTIVCRLTGKVVEAGDYHGVESTIEVGGTLVCLISKKNGEGRCYSKEGLELMSSLHPEGKLIEPVTGEVFDWGDLKKVYIS